MQLNSPEKHSYQELVNRPLNQQIEPLADQSNLTVSQLLLWLGQKLNPDVPLYNMAFLFTLSGGIDDAHFQAAFQALVDASDTLRTVIVEVEGIPQQRVLPQLDYEVAILDFSGESDPQARAQTWGKARCQKLFNLSERLFETVLIRLKDDCFAWYLNQHHLITDIESVKLLYQTLGDFYQRSLAGTLTQILPLPRYSDISFASPTPQAIEYWQQQFATPTALYNQTATPISPQTHRVSWDLGVERTAALKQLAIESAAKALTPSLSLFNVIASILLAYLSRISDEAEITIATPAHGRPTALGKATIGIFIELFPLQADIDPNETFASLFKKVNQASGMLLRYAQPGASQFSPSRDANVVLNFIPTQLPEFDGRSVHSEWIHPGAGDPRHHLRLQIHDFDNRGSLQLHFDFNSELFNLQLQECAPSHFLALVDAVIADQHQAIAKVDLLSKRERTQLMAFGRCQKVTVTKTVVESFEAQVTQIPEAIALTCNGQTLTYRQLNRQANQLAHTLRQWGVAAEVPVGICLPRSPEMLVAIWGILKAGGIYVPIDPSHPDQRIAHILQDTQVRWVLSQTRFVSLLGEQTQVVTLDTLDLDSQPEENLQPWPLLDQLAYVLYTSGSTGKPKGVEVEHRGLANYVQWATAYYVRERSLMFPLFTPLTFDLTVTSIFVPLLSGGQVVIYPETGEAIDLSLQRIVQDNQVDIIKLTPSHLALIQGMAIGSRVKTLILGGEDLKTSLAQEIAAASPDLLEIYNEYGPTEATVGCAIYRFSPELDRRLSVPIGTPAAGSEIYLLDGNDPLHLVPQGKIGEIFIGGAGLARGYLNQPELTTQKFVRNGLGNKRLYRTGDLGRWTEDGQLLYLGRTDRQVKIRGTRIELGEIEATLAAHPAVSASLVTTIQPTAHPWPLITASSCRRCGIADSYPGITFDGEGICQICRTYDTYHYRTQQYFQSLNRLRSRLTSASQRKQGQYDCMMLLSGGKDSTYALAQLVNMGFKVLAFTLDNGYISEQAKDNIRRVVKTLGVDHQFGTTPVMNEIFVDSLKRHCNVCNGCFKTIYTLSMKLAYELGIPCIVTGLSRGQFFETRLTEEWFTELFGQPRFDLEEIDQTILAARKAYHRSRDAISQLMDVDVFQNDDIFEAVEIVDFYRYCDVDLDEMLAFLDRHLPWIRPTDTGRSTNCRINNVGIYIHTQKRGYHNYALPYSWDVRMGHKTVEAAVHELNDEIDLTEVKGILKEIGYDETVNTKAQLAAYYVGSVSASDLRNSLIQQLPANLIPAYWIQLEQMPLTANGKVDMMALPDPQWSRRELSSTFRDPETDIEKTLARFWQQVLRIDRIGMDDNFFDLGGDSIMAIQIAARMAEVGLTLSPNEIFQYQTLSALAARVVPEVKKSVPELLTGQIPLTPIQQAFFEQNPQAPHHWNQCLLLEVNQFLDPDQLATALQELLERHRVLCLRFICVLGQWRQIQPDAVVNASVEHIDLSGQSVTEQQQSMKDAEAQLQTSLNLATGDLVRMAVFNLGSDRPHQLLVIIHHLVVDGVSWLTLLGDLETGYRKSQGETIAYPRLTMPFSNWSAELSAAVSSGDFDSELSYWLRPAQFTLNALPREGVNEISNTTASAQTIRASLGSELTQSLLQDLPKSSHIQANEVLLTALALSLLGDDRQQSLLIDVETHGREENMVSGANLVRTIGWFTAVFPLLLTLEPALDLGEQLRSVQKQWRQVPRHGVSYGLLRYLSNKSETKEKLSALPQSEILFNYLGDLDGLLPTNSLFQMAREIRLSRSPQEQRGYLLEINAAIFQGKLSIDWSYNPHIHRQETVQEWIDKFMHWLQLSIKGVQTSGDKRDDGYKPTDFPLADLNDQTLDKISALLNKVDRS